MRFVARQAPAGVAILDPEATRLNSIGMACTGDAGHDVQLFTTEGLIPQALAQNEVFRSTLRRIYEEMKQPLAAISACLGR